MTGKKKTDRMRLPVLFGAAILGVSMSISAFAGKSDTSNADARIDALYAEATQLGETLLLLQNSLGQTTRANPVPRIKVAQSQQQAAINNRLAVLENEMRTMRGQIEGLNHNVQNMLLMIANMQDDYEFRFEALEGGTPGKTSAATQPASDKLSESLPQSQNDALQSTVETLGTLSLDLEGQPLDLSFNPTDLADNADANAQYEAGYEAVLRGDYLFAKEQFSQFVALYPTHRLSSDAHHWLGEALMQNSEFEEAAEMFLAGYEKYPNSTRAPDMVLKLGIVLARSGERETACRTYVEVLRKYPNQPSSFKSRVKKEQSQSQC